jgi:hypothetical protein
MRALARFSPYLTGAVLTGIAGPYAEIELQLFPESEKDLGLFLLDRSILHTTQKARRFAGDRAHAISLVALNWEGHALRLSVFDRRDERLALKTSQAGKVAERARISEVEALLAASGRGSVLK